MDEPVLLLKSCIGNRALGWDLLPPGSEEYEFTDSNNVTWVYPGYGDSPERWKSGTTPEKLSTWYAGIQYDGDISRAKKVLNELDTYYPGATDYEIAGFFWWQGDRDSQVRHSPHITKQTLSDSYNNCELISMPLEQNSCVLHWGKQRRMM